MHLIEVFEGRWQLARTARVIRKSMRGAYSRLKVLTKLLVIPLLCGLH